MDRTRYAQRLQGCYIPLPTLFREGDLELNLPAVRRHVQFLIDRGAREGNASLLVAGGAGEFFALSSEERLKLLDAVLEVAAGQIGVVLGVQSANPRETMALAKAAARAGAAGIQASPPFYLPPTEDDAFQLMAELADAADVPLVFYATYWTGFRTTPAFVERLLELPTFVALKWAAPDAHEFERMVRLYGRRILIIDNQLAFVQSHLLGARALNLHPCNYAPEWGLRFWKLLEAGEYAEAQRQQARVVSPYYDLCAEIAKYTCGEGHLDKLCMELIGLEGGRNRPPSRDMRPAFRQAAAEMLRAAGLVQEAS
ncbi:MAG: dihydrodipicolinate synthase family protein [Pirellulales bacterium]|nr:dihydrodipicolinate synthase family protein [Pirellulales bacterium]